MHTRSIALALLAGCHPSATSPVIERSPDTASREAPTDIAPVARAKPPTSAADPQRARTMRLPDDASATTFGLAWHAGRWVVGVTFTDDRNAAELHPIGSDGFGAASQTVTISDGFPSALVQGATEGDPPWVIVEARDRDFAGSGRFVAHGFDGTSETVLTIPKGDPGIRESTVRHAWRSGQVPSGAAVWSSSIVRRLSDAELERMRKAAEERSSKGGRPAGGSTSPYQTLARSARYYGGGAKVFEALRLRNDGKGDLGWHTLAVDDAGWVGAHWVSKRKSNDEETWSIALHWFDRATKLRTKRNVAAPARSFGGELVLANDGTTYLVTDRSGPFEKDPALVVLTFDASGTPTPERTITVPGWVADSMAAFGCNGRTWLAIDPYAKGNEAVDVIELVPEGPLSATRLWSARDPEAAGDDSRPGRVVHHACTPGRAAIAFELRIATAADPKPELAPGLLIAEWAS